jgi:hypothetical protein
MSNMKKLMLGVSAAVISLTCAVATSAAWKVTDYNTADILIEPNGTHKVAVTYEWYDDATGLASGVVLQGGQAVSYGLAPFATVTYGTPAVERAWPNREYVAIFANGIDTKEVMYNGITENVQYRDAIYGWELARPHNLYTRRQALLNGQWYTDATYPVNFTGDVATVKAEYNNYYGFGYWRVDGNNITLMHRNLIPYAATASQDIETYALVKNRISEQYDKVLSGVWTNALYPNTVTDLTTYNAFGGIVVGSQPLVEIKKTFNLVVSGPEYAFDGTKVSDFGLVCNAANYDVNRLANFGVAELIKNMTGRVFNPATNAYDTGYTLANVRWVDAGYERVAPYRCYQFLEVDGVLLDGRYVGEYEASDAAGVRTLVDIYRPKVFRYTGLNADPVVMNFYTNFNIDQDRQFASPQVFYPNAN